jgi:hypothetical protein
MKTTIFTIALVFSLGAAFSQETEIVLPTSQHVINTKGTGGNKSITSEEPIIESKEKKEKEIALQSWSWSSDKKITTSNPNPNQEVTSEENKKNYVGHVTLMKREAKPTTPDEDEEQNEKNSESKRVKKTGHVTLNR